MKNKLFRIAPETEDQLEEMRYLLKMTFSAILQAAINDYYEKITSEIMEQKEAQS